MKETTPGRERTVARKEQEDVTNLNTVKTNVQILAIVCSPILIAVRYTYSDISSLE